MVMAGISDAEAALIGKALGDPTRLSIYSHIANRSKGLFCGELGECHGFSMATISHHLRVLAQAGLISSRRSGQYIFYRAIPARMAQYRSYLAKVGKTTVRTKSRRNV
jgi:ArsR family transcriptional regulator